MKKIFALFTLFIMLLTFIPYSVFALEKENNMVYASRSNQDSIYQLTQKESFDYFKALENDGLKIVKESITTVYTVDMLEYAKTGTLNITPMVKGKKQYFNDINGGNVYIAKVITSDNEYGGNIMFYVESDVAYNIRFTPSMALDKHSQSENKTMYMSSCSYVDHASRIQNIMNESKPVSVYDVKYVVIDDVADCFYVDINAKQVIIPVGYQNVDSSSEIDVVLTETTLKRMAKDNLDRYNELITDQEAWEKEHPGEMFDFTGYGSSAPMVSGCSRVDNIIDIFNYIEKNMNVSISNGIIDNTSPKNANTDNELIDKFNVTEVLWTGALCVIALLTVGAVLYMVKRHKSKAK